MQNLGLLSEILHKNIMSEVRSSIKIFLLSRAGSDFKSQVESFIGVFLFCHTKSNGRPRGSDVEAHEALEQCVGISALLLHGLPKHSKTTFLHPVYTI